MVRHVQKCHLSSALWKRILFPSCPLGLWGSKRRVQKGKRSCDPLLFTDMEQGALGSRVCPSPSCNHSAAPLGAGRLWEESWSKCWTLIKVVSGHVVQEAVLSGRVVCADFFFSTKAVAGSRHNLPPWLRGIGYELGWIPEMYLHEVGSRGLCYFENSKGTGTVMFLTLYNKSMSRSLYLLIQCDNP